MASAKEETHGDMPEKSAQMDVDTNGDLPAKQSAPIVEEKKGEPPAKQSDPAVEEKGDLPAKQSVPIVEEKKGEPPAKQSEGDLPAKQSTPKEEEIEAQPEKKCKTISSDDLSPDTSLQEDKKSSKDSASPPRIRLAVTDLDGTLLDSQGKVRTETIEMLRKVIGPECPLVVATARGANENVPYQVLPGPLYLLAMGGAHCLKRVDGPEGQQTLEEMFLQALPKAEATACVKASEELEATVLVLDGDAMWAKRGKVGWAEMEYFTGKAGTTALVKPVEDLTDVLAADRTISVVTTMPNQEEGEAKLKEALKNHPVEVFAMTPDPLISLKAAGVDKETGLRKLFAELGVTPEEVVAFGDGGNDVPMLKLAGLGVAVSNAGAKAKAAADRVSEWSCDQDAVAHELLALKAAGRL